MCEDFLSLMMGRSKLWRLWPVERRDSLTPLFEVVEVVGVVAECHCWFLDKDGGQWGALMCQFG